METALVLLWYRGAAECPRSRPESREYAMDFLFANGFFIKNAMDFLFAEKCVMDKLFKCDGFFIC